MKLSKEEVQSLVDLKNKAQEIVHEIGQIEVRKSQRLNMLNDLESKAQVVLKQAGSRLGIPDNVNWQTSPDGKVILFDESGNPTTAEALGL